MTDKKKNILNSLIYSIIGGVVVGIVVSVFSSFSSDNREVKKELSKLNRVKADIEYIDQRLVEIKKENERNQDLVLTEIRAVREQQTTIYNYIIENK
jgi:predicted PurR-regulated permease PerM